MRAELGTEAAVFDGDGRLTLATIAPLRKFLELLSTWVSHDKNGVQH